MNRWGWGLRHHAVTATLVFILTAAAGVVAGLFLLEEQATQFEARAIIAARALQIDAGHVSRLAQTFFADGHVAQQAIDEHDLPLTRRELVDVHARLEPIEENIVVVVVGRAGDASLAVQIANAVAESLVSELNKLGSGIGVFTLHSPARHAEPSGIFFPVLAAGTGTIAGLLAALGSVGLLLNWRRPVITAQDAARIAGTSRFVSVTGRPGEPGAVRGRNNLLILFDEIDAEIVAFISSSGDREWRSTVATATAQGLYIHSPTVLISDHEVPTTDEGQPTRLRRVTPHEFSRSTLARRMNESRRGEDHRHGATFARLILDGWNDDVVERAGLHGRSTKTVIVVTEGRRERDLLSLAESQTPESLAGVVFVRAKRRS